MEGKHEGVVSTPWATSGEMLFRAGFHDSPFQEEMEQCVARFADLLNEQCGVVDARRSHEEAVQDMERAKEFAQRAAHMYSSVIRKRARLVECKIGAVLGLLDENEEIIERVLKHDQTGLERKLLALCAQFGAILEREYSLHRARDVQRMNRYNQQVEEAQGRMEICEFALHLERETGGAVQLHRLSPDHPQFIRCRRATSENVKRDYFDSRSSYSGISVLDVFKIENKPLLAKFQECNASLDPRIAGVKGLFCTLPAESIEWVVVCGMHSSESLPMELKSVFKTRPTTQGLVRHGSAHSKVFKDSVPPPFPHSFSRFSTLENDRSFVQSSSHGDSEPRLLALCRVLVGNVFVTNEHNDGFPQVRAVMGREYDSMYSPNLEEYLVVNPNYVLPEFLIRFRYGGRYLKDEVGTKHEHKGAQIFPIDLSQASVPVDFQKCIEEGKREGIFPLGSALKIPCSNQDFVFGSPSSQTVEAMMEQLLSRDALIRAKEMEVGYRTARENANRQKKSVMSAIDELL